MSEYKSFCNVRDIYSRLVDQRGVSAAEKKKIVKKQMIDRGFDLPEINKGLKTYEQFKKLPNDR